MTDRARRDNAAWGRALLDFAFLIFAGAVITIVASVLTGGGLGLRSLGLSLIWSGSFAYAAHRMGAGLRDYFEHRLLRPL